MMRRRSCAGSWPRVGNRRAEFQGAEPGFAPPTPAGYLWTDEGRFRRPGCMSVLAAQAAHSGRGRGRDWRHKDGKSFRRDDMNDTGSRAPGAGRRRGQRGGQSGRRVSFETRAVHPAQHPEFRDPERRSAADHRVERRDGSGRDRRQLRREPRRAGAAGATAGADVQGERVHIPRGLARKLCATAPRDASPSTPATRSAMSRSAGAIWCWPRSMARPSCAMRKAGGAMPRCADFQNFVKLGYMSKWLHHSGGTVCEPTDIPVNKRHLDMLLAHMTLSRQALSWGR